MLDQFDCNGQDRVTEKSHAMFAQTDEAAPVEESKGGHCESMSICLRRVLSPVKQVTRLRLSLFSNMSMKAVKILDYGDSSNLSYEDAPIPEPGKGEVIILSSCI